ncbi:hypothetical protein DPMN_059084 [Dreissena polymorpha]|uniref:Uncharacterized protein n=1 Tax=Dreissena polymorpha TaxID=45954 RepID=A0A9D4C2X2_DREPO|nr:hypothetical protein DPMN_059084 [Dreissena polymorpha]
MSYIERDDPREDPEPVWAHPGGPDYAGLSDQLSERGGEEQDDTRGDPVHG